MYKNDVLSIPVDLVLLYFILMWIYTVTKACVHPHQGPGPKPLEGNGKCFHKLPWVLNQAQGKTRSLVKDKKKKGKKDNWGGISQCVCVGFNWFHGKLLGNEGFFRAPWARHRHSRCSFALYCLFCKVFCGTLRLSCVSEHWSPCCEPESPELQGKMQGKGRTSVQGEHL